MLIFLKVTSNFILVKHEYFYKWLKIRDKSQGVREPVFHLCMFISEYLTNANRPPIKAFWGDILVVI